MDLHRNNVRAVEAAAARGVRLEVTRFPDDTRTARDAAAAIGCPLGAIVKSLVLVSDDGPLMVLTSGSNRVSYGKVAAATGRSGIRRADAEATRAATSYPVGGVAPRRLPCPLQRGRNDARDLDGRPHREPRAALVPGDMHGHL